MKKDNSIKKEEIKSIIGLLAEYSSKIPPLIEKWVSLRKRMISLMLTVAISTITTGIAFSTLNSYYNRNQYEDVRLIPYFAGIIIILAIVFFQLASLEKKKIKSVEESIFLFETKLEKLVRKASQFEEHLKLDQSLALEIDLKLAEAEGTLREIQQIRIKRP